MEDLFSADALRKVSFTDKNVSNDGIFAIDKKRAKDSKDGVRVVIRFLPNLNKECTAFNPKAIEKTVVYVNLPAETATDETGAITVVKNPLNGYYDSMDNFGEKCKLSTLFWELHEKAKKSKSVKDIADSKLIKRTKARYFSYIQVLEHEYDETAIGKIFIFVFNEDFKNKIDAEFKEENVDIFDWVNGKDCVLKVVATEYGVNYDKNLKFKSSSPMKVLSDGKLTEVGTVEVNGSKQISPEWKERVIAYFKTRTCDIDTQKAVRWDAKTTETVDLICNKINAIVNGTTLPSSNGSVGTISNTSTTDGFFD